MLSVTIGYTWYMVSQVGFMYIYMDQCICINVYIYIYIYMFAALLSGYVAKRIARENRKKNVTTKNTRHHSWKTETAQPLSWITLTNRSGTTSIEWQLQWISAHFFSEALGKSRRFAGWMSGASDRFPTRGKKWNVNSKRKVKGWEKRSLGGKFDSS